MIITGEGLVWDQRGGEGSCPAEVKSGGLFRTTLGCARHDEHNGPHVSVRWDPTEPVMNALISAVWWDQ